MLQNYAFIFYGDISPNKLSLRGPGGVVRGVVCLWQRFLGDGRCPARCPVAPRVSRRNNRLFDAKNTILDAIIDCLM